ncbi:unnamed protein product [Paramecium pentaurelia]|uniref:Transmembrane protein n=1 Tax=Paramecium pentaurelia TaxID=43138 RepID=A0A8S1T3R9_9CILI|nr:unnamed protein product [Paramecium pentaurelia]
MNSLKNLNTNEQVFLQKIQIYYLSFLFYKQYMSSLIMYEDEAIDHYNEYLMSKRKEVTEIKNYKFNGKFNSKPTKAFKLKNKKIHYLTQSQILALVVLTFAVEGFAIEMVFISPLFLKLDTPELLDSSIWLFPPVINLILYPFIRYYSESKSHQLKNAMIYFIIVSIMGIGLLADTKSLYVDSINKKTSVLIISIVSFTVMDVGLEMLGFACSALLEDYVNPKQQQKVQQYRTFVDSFGKFTGFLVSSVLAFNFIYLNFDNFIENLSFAYLVGLIMILIGFGMVLISFPRKGLDLVQSNHKMRFSINSFLPGITFLFQLPQNMKIFLLSHFFTCGSQLFVSVYATLWSGITMLEEGPQQYNEAIRNIVFDIGISWGALALCMSAILHLLTTLFLKQLGNRYTSTIYMIVNALAGASLLYTWSVNEFYSIFITLPFWGVQTAVLSELPYKLANQLEDDQVRDTIKGLLPQMLNLTTFFSQAFMFFIIPLGFLLFSSVDDISVSMFMSGIFSLIGSFLVCFL